MKIAIIQTNPTVGDFRGNTEKILSGVNWAAENGADLAVTPEMSIIGYPARDLLLRDDLIRECLIMTEHLADKLADSIPVLAGLPEANPNPIGRPLFNSAAFLQHGHIKEFFRKTLLPTYDVFDEDRYFEPASQMNILSFNGHRLGISICEDVWNDRDFWNRPRYHIDPIKELTAHGVNSIINLSASPFRAGIGKVRRKMLSAMAAKYNIPIVYVNQVGGNDDLIFDGRSMAFDPDGNLVVQAKAFAEDNCLANLTEPGPSITPFDEPRESEIWKALVLGVRDYTRKCGFKDVLLGLSGGIDSSLTAAIAVEALGAERVLGVMMPSPFSSEGSLKDASALADNLGIRTFSLPISGIMSAFDDVLADTLKGLEPDTTEENIQARTRGVLLMALSNKFGSLLLTTGNKSELAVGYCTLYGDMSGGLAVISDVPKTTVFQICRWLNERSSQEIIPENVIIKPPSAELRFDQKDQDSLPPYDILDKILELHIEKHQSAKEIIKQGIDSKTVEQVIRMVKIAEFKRSQAAPGLMVTDRAFGSGWRMPIAWN